MTFINWQYTSTKQIRTCAAQQLAVDTTKLLHMLHINTFCGDIRCSKYRDPARTCMHVIPLNQLLKNTTSESGLLLTQVVHIPLMMRETLQKTYTEPLRALNLTACSLLVCKSPAAAFTVGLSSHCSDQAASVCHKHEPLSQLRNRLLSLVRALDCVSLPLKVDRLSLDSPHPQWKHPLDAK